MQKNFLNQLVNQSTRRGVPLDLFFTNPGLVGDTIAGDRLGHSNHKMMKFLIPKEVRKEAKRRTVYDLGKSEGLQGCCEVIQGEN